MTKFLKNVDVTGYVSQTSVTSSLVKTDSSGKLVAAVAGTDYQAPTTALLPIGGTAGQILSKIDATNYNTQWIDNFAAQLKHEVKLGATLAKGKAVYVSSANGTNMIVSAASNASEATSSKTLGLLETGGVTNDLVKVITEGLLAGLDTSTATAGDPVWLGTDGNLLFGLANKPVAPAHMVFIGIVTRVQSVNGEIFVKVQNGFELNEIHDVSISSLANNHTLVWESATSLWKNKTIAATLGYTPADDAAVVKLTGDQTVAGVKTFTSVVNAPTLSLNGGVLAGNNIVSMRSNPTGGQFRIEKSDGSLSAYPFYIGADGTALAYYYNAAGALKVLLHTDNTSYFGNSLSVGYSTYATTSYMLDVNGTARFTNTVTIGNFDTLALRMQAGTSTGSSYLRFFNSAGTARGYFGLFWSGTSDYMVMDAGALEMNFGSSNKFTFTGGGTAQFSGAVTATNITLGSGTIGSIPSWMKVITTDATQSGIGAVYNNKAVYLYNNGSAIKLDAYDYATSTGLNIQIGGNGGKIIASNGQVQFTAYTSATSYSGTAAGYLAFDSSGNIITVAGVSSTDNTKLPLTGGALTGPLTITGNGSYLGDWGYKTLELNDTSGYAGIFFKNGANIWITRRNGADNAMDWAYSTNATAQGTGTFTQKMRLATDEWWVSTYPNYKMRIVGGDVIESLNGTSATTLYLQYHSNTGGNVNIAASKFIFYNTGTLAMTGVLQMSTSGTSYISMGRFPNSVTNSGEAWIGRAADRNSGTMTVQLGGNSPTDRRFEVVDYAWSTVLFNVNSDGNVFASSSMRAPIFYDSNDTGYYGNFAGTSSVWGLAIRGDNGASSVDNQIFFWGTGGTTTSAIGFKSNAGYFGNPTGNGDGYNTYFTMDTPGRGWVFRRGVGGGDFGAAYTAGWILNNGIWQANSEMRAPVFRFTNSSNNAYLTGNSDWGFRVINDNGYIQFGPANNSWTHIYSDKSFYFNQELYINGTQVVKNSGTWSIDISGNSSTATTASNSNQLQGSSAAYLFNNMNNSHTTYSDFNSFGNFGVRYIQGGGNAPQSGQFYGFTLGLGSDYAAGTYASQFYWLRNTTNPYIWIRYQEGGSWLGWTKTSAGYADSAGSAGSATYSSSVYFSGSSSKQITDGQWAGGGSYPGYTFSGGNSRFGFSSSSGVIDVYADGNFYATDSSYLVLHTGNYTSYAINRNGDNITAGNILFTKNNGTSAVNNSSSAALQVYSTDNNSAFMSFHKGGYYAVNFGLDGDNVMRIGGWSAGANRWQLDMSGNQTIAGDYNGQAYYSSNWFRAYGDCGIYSQDYGGHMRRNTRSYGNWEIFGYAKNGYTGIVNVNNYIVSWMLNTSGDFGFLTENGNWWNLFYNNGNNCWGIGTDNTYSGDGFRCIKYGSSQYGWTTWSDRRAKENISNITGALDKVLNMRGVYFNYISDEAKNKRVGFIAQELESVLPEAVRYAEEIDEYNVEYAQIVSVLAEATKEQNDMIVSQATRIEQLELLVQQLINSNNGISN